jgi:sulfate adenylyltransferase
MLFFDAGWLSIHFPLGPRLQTEPQTARIDLLAPYGGSLIDLTVAESTTLELKSYANTLPSLRLSERSTCDLELLATGAFSPLDRFMGKADHERVLHELRLVSGHVAPIPITLPLPTELGISLDDEIALRDSHNELLALMTVDEIYEFDVEQVAQLVLGTKDLRHPFVAEMRRWGRFNVSGKLRVLQLPRHYDFGELRHSPSETRLLLEQLGHQKVVAFQTRNPFHRAHEEITKRATAQVDGALLLHPVVGLTRPGDVDHYTRVRTYKALAENYYDPDRILLSLLPLAMRLAGPREALWHAIIRRNYGANHMIIGRNHASPGLASNSKPFYEPSAAQELAQQFSDEIEVGILAFDEFVYLPEQDVYEEAARVPPTTRTATLSGTQVREDYLQTGRPLPLWFARPEVAAILADSYPARDRQGVCIWFTGLSGAGKSTTAEILTVLLQEHGRQTTVLDGDVVRTHLSQGLGFSKHDRDLNIRRIGFVAAEIVRHGGMAVCAAVSPYRATRNEVRNLVGAERFVEVFVDTPLAECERRDTKGMYAKARRGEIKSFTGIDDPYEPPQQAEITLTTIDQPPEKNAQLIIAYLRERGFIAVQ